MTSAAQLLSEQDHRDTWSLTIGKGMSDEDIEFVREAGAKLRELSQRYRAALRELCPGCEGFIREPFRCDYGLNISIGEGSFVNFDCVFLDLAPIRIGRHTLIGPKVQLLTALHPFDAAQRRTGLEAGRPITVGDDCWLGGGVIVCPGVAIGDRSVIGAGAVVTRDIPADSVAVGNPARVIRTLTRQDETE